LESLQRHYQAGDVDETKYRATIATIPQNPADFPAWQVSMLKNIMGAKERLELERQQAGDAETARRNKAQEQNAAGQLAVSQGQLGVAQGSLAVSRDRLAHEKQQPRGQFLETPDGYVLGDPRAGTVAPVLGPNGKQVQGKSADRALTDSQAKANLFGSRMQEADKILKDMEGKGSQLAVNTKMGMEKLPVIGAVAGPTANMLMSSDSQQLEQAQRDFVNAVLRRESGAVISDAEFANAQKQYFPQPGDSKQVIDQKRRNRQLATEAFLAEVPEAKRGVPSLKSSGVSVPQQLPQMGFKIVGVK
jgi:hypothetical protein